MPGNLQQVMIFTRFISSMGPHFLHDLVCQRVAFFPLNDLVENSARQQEAEAKNIPKVSANHPKYITPGKMLVPG